MQQQIIPVDLYVGFDAGGTRTRALVADVNGRFVSYGCGGPGNLHNLDKQALEQNYRDAYRAALKGITAEGRLNAAFVGAAGVKAEGDRSAVIEIVARALDLETAAVDVRNDSESALAGGMTGKPGIVLIVGTGSHAFGRSEDGATAYCGGWGCLLDDIGSGYWLGLQGLRITAQVVDGREPPSAIADAIIKKLKLDHPFDLLPRVYTDGMGVSEIASLAPTILECAENGDRRALALLEEGVQGLAALIAGAGRAIGADRNPLPVVFAGGLAESKIRYSAMLREAVLALDCVSSIHEPELPPVCGSLLLAMQKEGVEPSAALIERLKSLKL